MRYVTFDQFAQGTIKVPAPLELPMGQRTPGDVAMSRCVAIGLPLWVGIIVHADGHIDHFWTEWRAQLQDNTYWHLSNGSMDLLEGLRSYDGRMLREPRGPTEDQRRTIARIYLHDPTVLAHLELTDLTGGVGRTVYQWAFSEMDPQEISRRYGDGRRIYLA